jgi:hypothetical protein
MPLAIAVFLLSAAALATEVLLMRVLSIVEWHHFAWMVISLALLGYAAAGTFVALARRLLLRRLRVVLIACAVSSSAALLVSLSLVRAIRFNSLELIWDPHQFIRLFALYLLLSVPFFAIATFMATIFTALRGAVARLYRADLLGAGFGAATAIAVLFFVPVDVALRGVAASASLAALFVALTARKRIRRVGTAVAIVGLAMSIGWPPSLLRPPMSPYKELAQAMRIPGVRVIAERSGPMGRIDVVANDVIPFRHAPGLSLAFTEEIPRQLLVFVDGTVATAVPAGEPGRPAPAYSDFTTSAAALALRDLHGARVLVIGMDIPAILDALARGARAVDVVEHNRQLIAVVRNGLVRHNPHLSDPRITFHAADARAMLQRTSARWRIIETSIEGGGSGGEEGLRENYLLTAEGLALLANRLEPGGIVSLTGALRMPPNEIMRLIATAGAATESRGGTPRNAIAVIRSWNTATLLLGRDPLSAADMAVLEQFAARRSFDIDVPTRTGGAAFNVLERPYLAEAATAAFGEIGRRRDFLNDYKFDISPARDDRPFFFHFFRWRALPELIALRDRGGASLIQTGYLVAAATLVQALTATVLLVLVPLALAGRRRRTAGANVSGAWRVVLYFGSIAVAFLSIEIAFLQTFTLFLAHPLYAASLVLGSLLVSAGIGSGIARRFRRDDVSTRRAVLVALALLALLYAAGLRPAFMLLASAPDAAKAVASLLMVTPIAVLMGMPFPLGIAHFGSMHRTWIPWAWAINGSASVISAVAVMLLALSYGIRSVIITAAVGYAAAAIALVPLADRTATSHTNSA